LLRIRFFAATAPKMLELTQAIFVEHHATHWQLLRRFAQTTCERVMRCVGSGSTLWRRRIFILALDLSNRTERHSTGGTRFMDHPCPERFTDLIIEMRAEQSELRCRGAK
jgi:hypothetical protein